MSVPRYKFSKSREILETVFIIVFAMTMIVLIVNIIYRSSSYNRGERIIIDPERFVSNNITVHYSFASGTEKKIDIQNQKIVKSISLICIDGDFSQPINRIAGLCTIFLDFNNGTLIGIYDDLDYGNVESKIEVIGRQLNLPKGLNAYVRKLIEQYEAGVIYD